MRHRIGEDQHRASGSAAGVAGLIKTILAFKHKQIPPSLHFKQPNQRIDFAESPFYVNNSLREWQVENDSLRRAGVSSFGIGGTNAHVIVEEAPPLVDSDQGREWQVLFLSARSETALETATSNLAEYLKRNPQVNLADVASRCTWAAKSSPIVAQSSVATCRKLSAFSLTATSGEKNARRISAGSQSRDDVPRTRNSIRPHGSRSLRARGGLPCLR